MSLPSSATSPQLFPDQTVRRLLVPVVADQRTERGVTVALQLAVAWGTPVVLMHVGPLSSPEGAASPVVAMATELRRRHPTVTIETLAFDHVDVAVAISSKAGAGTLVVLATDHANQWLGVDSVAERLVQLGSTPLLLIGPNADRYLAGGEVIVALDGTPLAEDGLAPGCALATAAGSGVRVVSVIPEATVEHIEHLKDRGQRVSESVYLRSLADRLSDAEASIAWEIVHGDDAIEALASLARRRDAAIVVATTHAGTGVLRQRFGSTSMGLVERSPVPVLIVQPVGAATTR